MAEAEARRRSGLRAGAITLAAVFSLACNASNARPAVNASTITLTMLANVNKQAAYDVLIPNFERVYANIKIEAAYAPLPTVAQLELTELAAGNAPDLLATVPGCGSSIAVCVLARAGDLAPMVNKPWVKWSLQAVTSADKYGPALYAFSPTVSPEGVFTNDDLFKKLGLRVPQTFAQLLDVCAKAKAAGTYALLLAGGPQSNQAGFLVADLAVATVYGKNKQWSAKLRAGTVTFDGTLGWHEALQEFGDMNNAGCFQPGAAGATTASVFAQFAQGQGLMVPNITGQKAVLDASNPPFAYSHHPFPGSADGSQTRTFLRLADSLGVNAHSSAQAQQAAQTFVDFIARPKQNALYAQTTGGLTQYQFMHDQVPAFMSDYAAIFAQHKYVVDPDETWWNADVELAFQSDTIGILTGQRSIDDVLNAMDAAWKEGPQ
jgi:raffinose/stachyose/melibiose transport system substrate-binding protein